MAKDSFKIQKSMTLIPQSVAPTNPENGDLYYDSVLEKFQAYQDGSWGDLGGGEGTGSGEINTIADSSTATNWSTSGSGITIATTTTTTDLPLAGIITSAIKITPVSSTDYARYRFTMPAALKQRKLKIAWEQLPLSGYASGDLRLEIHSNPNSDYSGSFSKFNLSTDSSSVTAIPNATGRFQSTFDTDNSDYYELRIVRNAGTTALNIANVVVGPGIQPQGAIVGEWQALGPITASTAQQANALSMGGVSGAGTDSELLLKILPTCVGLAQMLNFWLHLDKLQQGVQFPVILFLTCRLVCQLIRQKQKSMQIQIFPLALVQVKLLLEGVRLHSI
jgi:hypothetical protein